MGFDKACMASRIFSKEQEFNMAFDPLKARITSTEVLKAHLEALGQLDPRLMPVLRLAGEVPLRLGRPGFAGLANIVSSQLLSAASARAIHCRVEALAGRSEERRVGQECRSRWSPYP